VKQVILGRAGLLTAPVERTYPIEEIKTAVAHAERAERTGKILVTPNGDLRQAGSTIR
jgi:hypothetical protein